MTRNATRKTIASLAATLLAATTFSGLAEAGNGVRLGFGGPLGSFVAHPAGGGSSSYTGASYGAKKHCAPKVQSVQRQSEPKARRQVASSERRAVDDDVKSDRGKKSSKPKTQVAAVASDPETGTDTSDVTLTGSRALAAQDAAPVATEVDETDTGTPAGEAAEATTADGDATAAGETTTEEATKTAEARDVGCKKFIPAIGVTVSVGCK